MTYKPLDAYTAQFTTQRVDTGNATNADSLPTATATKNGTDDAGFSLTVTNMTTGRYKITGTVPSSYVAGDRVQIIASATVNAIAGTAVVEMFVMDSKRHADLNDFDTTTETVSVNDVTASALSDFFTTNSGTTFASSVTGSVVREIVNNAIGASNWTVSERDQIRQRLGIDGDHEFPSATGDLTDIKDIIQAATRK